MSKIIKIENLSKLYHLGETLRYNTFRDKFDGWMKKRSCKKNQIIETQTKPNSDSIWALKDISLSVDQGEVIGIIGRNGAGKSTLLKVLSRITEPTSGKVTLKGRVASLLEVGTGFHPELTGRENVYLNGSILGMTKMEIESRFDEIVSFSEIEKFIDTPVKRYSSGMYVRLAFAVTAHLDPEILLVDEVLAVGDLAFQNKCLGKMSEVSKAGKTVIFVSHNLSAIKKLCNRVIIMGEGKLLFSGPTHLMINKYYQIITALKPDKDRNFKACIKYLKWEIDNNPINKHVYLSGEECVFSFYIEATRLIKHINFGLLLYNEDSTLILSARSIDYGMPLIDITPGKHKIKFFLKNIPVRSGSYQFEVSINSETQIGIDQWLAIPKLNVIENNGSNMPDKWKGLINVPTKFVYES